jgi:Phosphoesterase family
MGAYRSWVCRGWPRLWPPNSLLREEEELSIRKIVALSLVTLGLAGIALEPGVRGVAGPAKGRVAPKVQAGKKGAPATPIQHLVVIFQENVSFDHYFGTYPNAANPSGEPQFTALPGTPTVNGLTPTLLTDNPNFLNANNGTGPQIPSGLTARRS